MLKNLSRIIGVTGSCLSLLESLYLTAIFTFAVYSPGGGSQNGFDLVRYGFIVGIVLILLSAGSLAASLNVKRAAMAAGTVLAVSGAAMLAFLIAVIIPRTSWILGMPSMLIFIAGILALAGFKKTGSVSDESCVHRPDAY